MEIFSLLENLEKTLSPGQEEREISALNLQLESMAREKRISIHLSNGRIRHKYKRLSWREKRKKKEKKKSLERESIFYGKNRGEPERFTFRSVRSLLVYAFLTLAA